MHRQFGPGRCLKTRTIERPKGITVLAAARQQHTWQTQLTRCSAAIRHLTAAARQGPLSNAKSSLCIGGGVSALAFSGGSGPNGPSSNGGSNWGSGGDGWQAGPGHSSISNALYDVAAVNEPANDTVEEVILLDVSGEVPCIGSIHIVAVLS